MRFRAIKLERYTFSETGFDIKRFIIYFTTAVTFLQDIVITEHIRISKKVNLLAKTMGKMNLAPCSALSPLIDELPSHLSGF